MNTISVDTTVLHEECHSSLNKANFHIPFTVTGTLICESIIKVYIQNIVKDLCKNRKIIFTSNQCLCLCSNELKFESTTCQLISHLMNLSDVLSCPVN